MAKQQQATKYSVIVPVFNSAPIVGQTIERIVAFFEDQGWSYELVLINDGSRDESWNVLREKALTNPNISAIDLLRNYGQHTALLCGFDHSTGDYAITLDDDLQNPPEEIIHLVSKANEGYDVVFGRFRKKRHAWFRRLGSTLISQINQRVFHQPKDLTVSNFRIIRRDVLDRICAYRTNAPYVTGLALMFAAKPGNVPVDHRERPIGKSQYGLFRIIRLVTRILFSYSAWPLRFVTIMGTMVSGFSFVLGVYFMGRRIIGNTQVPGWTSVVVLLSFFNGVSLLVMSMLGEYIVRLLSEVSAGRAYHIKDSVSFDA